METAKGLKSPKRIKGVSADVVTLHGTEEQAKAALDAAAMVPAINDVARSQRERWHPGLRAW